MSDELTKVFAKLDKLNPDASTLSDSALSKVDDYIDTGCMVLNSIISGSLHVVFRPEESLAFLVHHKLGRHLS